jgi:hypothetical protein
MATQNPLDFFSNDHLEFERLIKEYSLCFVLFFFFFSLLSKSLFTHMNRIQKENDFERRAAVTRELIRKIVFHTTSEETV